MAIQTGTHTIADLASNDFAGELVLPSNVAAVDEAIRRTLAIHNQQVDEMVGVFAEISEERSTTYGVGTEAEMHKKDEFTRGPTQKITRGGKVEFPLDAFQIAVGWTADFLRRATVQDMARMLIARQNAHVKRIMLDIREAFFGPTNYTWYDRREDEQELTIRRLVNADGQAIPTGPNGESFTAASHTHYDAVDFSAATSAAKATALAGLVQDVVEHGHSAGLAIFINQANETEVRASDDFEPLLYPNVIPSTAADRAVGVLDITDPNNRRIGFFRGVPVETRPWVPSDYAFATATADPNKPLRMRVPRLQSERGLYLAGTIATFPLQAEYMEASFGFGAYTRTNGAVLYLGGTTYTAPTF